MCDQWALRSVLVVLIGFLAGACDNSMDPLDTQKGTYSIYGALNIEKSENYIRVKNLNNSFAQEDAKILGADVTLEDLDRGVAQPLEDSVVVYDGVYTHNFKTTMDILPDTPYRVTVDGDEGTTVRATGTTPKIASSSVNPTKEDCRTSIAFTFEPVSGSIQLSIGVHYGSLRFYTKRYSPQEDSERVRFFLTPEELLKKALGKNLAGDDVEDPVRCHDLTNNTVVVKSVVYGPDFFGKTPTDSLSIPGGAGRFGGFYRDQFSFQIDTTDVYEDT